MNWCVLAPEKDPKYLVIRATMCYTCGKLYGALLLRVDCLLKAARYRNVVRRKPRNEKNVCKSVIEPCTVAIVSRNLSLPRANRNFMPAVDSPMHQAVAQNAVLRISKLLGGRIVREVVVATVGFARPVRCI